MNYKEYLNQYLEEKTPDKNSIFLVQGCMEQYLLAETEEEKKFFLSCLENISEKSGVRGKNLFVLYDAADKEIYREKIEDMSNISDFIACLVKLPEKKFYVEKKDVPAFCRELLPSSLN